MASVEQRSEASVTPPPATRPRTRPPASRRRWRLARTLVVAALLVGAVLAIVYSVSLVRHARQAQSALEAFKTSLQGNDSTAAARHLKDADAALAVARHRYDSFPLQVLRRVPLVGWPGSGAGKVVGGAGQGGPAGGGGPPGFPPGRG